MKIKRESIIGAIILTIFLVGAALFFVGCAGPRPPARPPLILNSSPRSLENKAYALTLFALSKVWQNHTNALPKIIIARDDLIVLDKADTISVDQIEEIIERLPPDTFSGDKGLYIQTGILFFKDDLGGDGAKNPEQVRAAARGMRRACDTFIESKK